MIIWFDYNFKNNLFHYYVDLEKNIEFKSEETLYGVNDDGESQQVKTNNKHSEEGEEKEEELISNNEKSKK